MDHSNYPAFLLPGRHSALRRASVCCRISSRGPQGHTCSYSHGARSHWHSSAATRHTCTSSSTPERARMEARMKQPIVGPRPRGDSNVVGLCEVCWWISLRLNNHQSMHSTVCPCLYSPWPVYGQHGHETICTIVSGRGGNRLFLLRCRGMVKGTLCNDL